MWCSPSAIRRPPLRRLLASRSWFVPVDGFGVVSWAFSNGTISDSNKLPAVTRAKTERGRYHGCSLILRKLQAY